MGKYICTICGYIYDEAKGIPEAGIAPGTAWEELSQDWVCPLCGATKAEFEKQEKTAATAETKQVPKVEISTDMSDMKELSPLEMSAICTNLARGCEKQYKSDEARLFIELAGYFKAASVPAKEANISKLIDLINKDLEEGFPQTNAVASRAKDRGALRALVWSEKVTRILKSLLTRYSRICK